MAEATPCVSEWTADQMSGADDNEPLYPLKSHYEMDSYLQALVNAGCPRFDEVAS